MRKQVKLMIVEDHGVVRQSFVYLLQNYGFRIIYEVSDGKEAVKLLKEVQPEVVLLGIDVPVANGIEIVKIIKQHYPKIKVVVLTDHYYKVYVTEMPQISVDAFLPRNCNIEELIKTILNNTSSNLLLKHHFDNGKFSEREVEIIKLISREFTNKQIAGMLSLSTRTIDGHKERILKKTKAKNSVGIVMYAIKHGLLD